MSGISSSTSGSANMPNNMPISDIHGEQQAPTTPSMATPDVSSIPAQLTNLISSPEQSLIDLSTLQTLNPQQLSQLVANMPQLMNQQTQEQTNNVLSLLSSNQSTLSSVFNSLTSNPAQQQTLTALVSTIVSTGNLALLANVPQTTTAMNATQQALTQVLTSMLVNSPNNAALMLSLPNVQAETANLLPQNVALMLSQGALGMMQQQLGTPTTPTQNQTQLQQFLGNLMTLTFSSQNPNGIQIQVPATTSSTPINVADLAKQLQEVTQQFSSLQQTVQQEQIPLGHLKGHMAVPEQLTKMLPTISPQDQGTLVLMKAWLDNSSIVQQQVAHHAGGHERATADKMKDILALSVGKGASEAMEKQLIAQQQLDPSQIFSPNLLNFYKLKDVVQALSDTIKNNDQAALLKAKELLVNAAKEVIQIASGRPSSEYGEVGVFHYLLPPLATRMKEHLPAKSQDLEIEAMASIALDLLNTFESIKAENLHDFREVLKRHPRTLLWLLMQNAPMCDDIRFQGMPLALLNDPHPRKVEMHIMQLRNQFAGFEKQPAFFKYQPRVLEIFLKEGLRDLTGDTTKCALRVVHKAISECSETLDLEL